jgi:hypothetical protein
MSSPKMSFRPNTNADRRLLVSMIRGVEARDDIDARARVLVLELLQPAAEAWAAADDAARASVDDEARARADEDHADAAWDACLAALVWSLRSAAGAPLPLGQVIGVGLADAQRLPWDSEVELTRRLTTELSARGLAHDADALQNLQAAAGDLHAAGVAAAQARAARVAAHHRRAQAELDLDRAATGCARALRAYFDDATARQVLPVF